MATYTVHAGHAADGKAYSGAAGVCKESVENRKIKDAIIKYLRAAGHTVYDCTVDSGSSQSGIVTAIKKNINSHSGCTANISVHLNASDAASANGTECCIYALTGEANAIGNRINSAYEKMGFTNRGNKERTNLGVLKGITNGGANVLIETFFCTNANDKAKYDKIGSDAMGKATAEAIMNQTVSVSAPAQTSTPAPTPTPAKNVSNGHLKDLQGALNSNGFTDGSGRKLATDGLYGTNTDNALGKVALSTKTIHKYVDVTAWVQCRIGTTPDGLFGNGTKNAVIEYQRKKGLTADGIVGRNTIKAILRDYGVNC